MGYCDTSNYDTEKLKHTTCTSGYDQETGACCSYGMYVFWNVVMWVALCLMCGLCIYSMARRAKERREWN